MEFQHPRLNIALEPDTPEFEQAYREALKEIRQFGDPVLKSKASPVTKFDDALRVELGRMALLMHDAFGAGLAANQVGRLHRVFVFRAKRVGPVTTVINPVIEWSSTETEVDLEGCLSIPGVYIPVERPVAVRVRAQGLDGKEFEIEADDRVARCLQHEHDHLDGVLMLDRTTPEYRREALNVLSQIESGTIMPGEGHVIGSK